MEQGNKPSTGGAHPSNNNNPPTLATLPLDVINLILQELPGSSAMAVAILSKYFSGVFKRYIQPKIEKLEAIREMSGGNMKLFSVQILDVDDEPIDLLDLDFDEEIVMPIPKEGNLFTFFADFPFCLTLDEIEAVFKHQGPKIPSEIQMAYLTFLIAWVVKADTDSSFEKRAKRFLDIARYSALTNNSKWRNEVFTEAEDETLFLCLKFLNPYQVAPNLRKEDAQNLIQNFLEETLEDPVRSKFNVRNARIFLTYSISSLIYNNDLNALFSFLDFISGHEEETDPLVIYFLDIITTMASKGSSFQLTSTQWDILVKAYQQVDLWDQMRGIWERFHP